MEPEDVQPNGDDQDGMRPMVKVLRINLIILLVYAGLFLVYSFVGARGEEMEMWLVGTGLTMLAHGGINLVVAVLYFIMRKWEQGKGALLSGLVLLIVGFSSCVAAFTGMSFH